MAIFKNKTLFFILLAFSFSVVCRLIWVYFFSDYEQLKFNNQFMINTNDGYYWAEGARDIISKVSQENDLSPIDGSLSILSAIIYKILPISFESLIFYLPIVLSSLLVIPIILIFKSIGKNEIGFVAALLSSIAMSYYNRTMVGYYDTDMLNIVFPMFLLWSLVIAFRLKEDKYILFTGLEILLYRWWYPQSYSLEFAFFILISIYLLYLYIKKQDYDYELKLLIIMLFAMSNLPMGVRLFIVIFMYLALKKDLLSKYLNILFLLAIFSFFLTGGFNPIWGKLKGYVFIDEIAITKEVLSLHFYTVMQTIKEAGRIAFEIFANRISGHTSVFIVSLIGYLWLVYKYRIFILSLPILGLGFLAYIGGLRFTIYAVPIMAMGFAFFIFELANIITKRDIYRYITIGIFTLLGLYPNIKHIIDYKVPTVFFNQEVKVLDKLKNIASREDYVISWWDYGYPIRYYSDVKTLADGGKHSGSVNFPISYILTNPQHSSAKMSRLDVEYTEQRFLRENKDKFYSSNIAQMTLEYGLEDTNDFLELLQSEIALPKKTREIYLYLPNRMMNILHTVELFSNIDLMSGDKKNSSLFYQTSNFNDTPQQIDLNNGIKLYKDGKLDFRGSLININRFIITQYDNQGTLHIKEQIKDRYSEVFVIFMKNYNKFLVLDRKLYNSLYIQLFVLEKYDKKLFEPIILNPMAKVYRLLI